MKYYVESRKIFQSSKTYTVLFILALFDPLLLSFLPWYSSPFADASYFPTLSNMRLCLLVKLLQLLVTFVAQIMVALYNENQRTGDGFKALLYLNLSLSGLAFFVRIIEAYLKRGLLTNSGLSEESEAANHAADGLAIDKSTLSPDHKSLKLTVNNEQKLSCDTESVELTEVYNGRGYVDRHLGIETAFLHNNPMHFTAANESSRETDPFLKLKSRIGKLEEKIGHDKQQNQKRLEAIEANIGEISSSLSSNSKSNSRSRRIPRSEKEKR